MVRGDVGVGFYGALLDALEGLHEAVGGLVAVAEGVLGFVGETERDDVTDLPAGALPEPGGFSPVLDGEFNGDFVSLFFCFVFEAFAEGVVGDFRFLGIAVEVDMDLVEVLAAAEAFEAVVDAVGFAVKHDVDFPEGAFDF